MPEIDLHLKAGNWETAYDDEGHAYYYNTETQESQWDTPREIVEAMPDHQKKDRERRNSMQNLMVPAATAVGGAGSPTAGASPMMGVSTRSLGRSSRNLAPGSALVQAFDRQNAPAGGGSMTASEALASTMEQQHRRRSGGLGGRKKPALGAVGRLRSSIAKAKMVGGLSRPPGALGGRGRKSPVRSGPGSAVDWDHWEDVDGLDQDVLRKMQTEVDDKALVLKQAKQLMERRTKDERAIKEHQLGLKLKELEQADNENQQRVRQLHLDLQAATKKQGEGASAELTYEQELWRMERELRLDEVVEHRIELSKLRKHRSRVEKQLEMRMLQGQAIRDEMDQRGDQSEKKLQKALKRADFLKRELNSGMFDKEAKQAMAKKMLDAAKEDEERVFRLADEMAAERARKHMEAKQKRELALRQLNGHRMQVEEQFLEVLKNKRYMATNYAKGIEFLTALELGDAPPTEFLVRNQAGSEADLELYRAEDEMTLDQLAASVKESRRADEVLIARLKAGLRLLEIEKFKAKPPRLLMPAYNRELGAMSYGEKQRKSYYAVREVLFEIADKIITDYEGRKLTFPIMKKEERRWEISKKKLEDTWVEKSRDRATQACSAELVLEVIQEEVRAIWNERVFLQLYAQHVSLDMILSAVAMCGQKKKSASDLEKERKTLPKSLSEMSSERHARDATVSPSDLIHPANHSHHLVALQKMRTTLGERGLDKKARAKLEKQRSKLRKSKAGAAAEEAKVDEDEDEDEEAFDVQVKTIPRDFEPSPEALRTLDRERNFWRKTKNFAITLDIKDSLDRRDTISCFRVAPGSRRLAVGTDKGSLLIFELPLAQFSVSARKQGQLLSAIERSTGRPEFSAQLLKVAQSKSKDTARLSSIRWSFDGGEQIVTVDVKGFVRVWSLSSTARTKENSAVVKTDNKDFVPLRMGEFVMELSQLNMQREEAEGDEDEEYVGMKKSQIKKAKAAKEKLKAHQLRPKLAMFHPAVTLLGTHPSLMIGTNSGLAVKYNMDPTERGMLLGDIIAPEEPSNPMLGVQSLANIQAASGQAAGAAAAAAAAAKKAALEKPGIRREFFQGHDASKGELLMMGFVEHSSTTLVTVDTAGYVFVWDYTLEQYSGFGWFVPSVKYRIVPEGFSAKKARKALRGDAKKRSKAERKKSQREGSMVGLLPDTFQEVLLGAEMTVSGREIVVMARRSGRSGRGKKGLVFAIFDLLDGILLDTLISVDQIGATPPPFKVSPVLDAAGGDFLYVLMGEAVRIISLNNGREVQKRALPATAKDRGKAVLDIQVAGPNTHFIVGQDRMTSLTIFQLVREGELEDQEENPLDTSWEGLRLWTAPPEHRVRTIHWDLGHVNAEKACERVITEIILGRVMKQVQAKEDGKTKKLFGRMRGRG